MIGKNNQQGNNNGNNQTGPLLRTMVGDDGSYERYVYDLLGNKIFRYYRSHAVIRKNTERQILYTLHSVSINHIYLHNQ